MPQAPQPALPPEAQLAQPLQALPVLQEPVLLELPQQVQPLQAPELPEHYSPLQVLNSRQPEQESQHQEPAHFALQAMAPLYCCSDQR